MPCRRAATVVTEDPGGQADVGGALVARQAAAPQAPVQVVARARAAGEGRVDHWRDHRGPRGPVGHCERGTVALRPCSGHVPPPRPGIETKNLVSLSLLSLNLI